jgi:hypothetical protein
MNFGGEFYRDSGALDDTNDFGLDVMALSSFCTEIQPQN